MHGLTDLFNELLSGREDFLDFFRNDVELLQGVVA
jgi:hypothetical protein